jgi:cytochrome c peroxidase
MKSARVGLRHGWLVTLALGFTLAAGCQEESKRPIIDLGPSSALASVTPIEGTSTKSFNPRLLRRFKAVRAVLSDDATPVNPAQVALGRMLYFERRISRTKELSCNSCHPLDRYGADGDATSLGHHGGRGSRNSPTVYHAAGFFAQFWDGRALNVEEQAKGPILNPVEMGMRDGQEVEQVLAAIPGYKEVFAKAFPGDKRALSYDNVGRAIGAFERGLVTPSRWDDYLGGKKDALSGAEMEGLRVFTNVGCMVCHTGEFVGGSMFAKVGAVEPWPNQKDQGRYEVTKKAEDKMLFKVPTLRNVEHTAPYFHDGSSATLDQAVRKMGKHQLGLDLSVAEVSSIVAWLKSLSGPLPTEYIKAPPLPGAG